MRWKMSPSVIRIRSLSSIPTGGAIVHRRLQNWSTRSKPADAASHGEDNQEADKRDGIYKPPNWFRCPTQKTVAIFKDVKYPTRIKARRLKLRLMRKVSRRRRRGEHVEAGHVGRLHMHRRVSAQVGLASGRTTWTTTRVRWVGRSRGGGGFSCGVATT